MVEGDVGGYGNVANEPSVADQDLGSCATLCNARPRECCSFEWSPSSRICNLNQECAPTGKKFKDYLFCVKGAFDKNSMMLQTTTAYMCYAWTPDEEAQLESLSEREVCESLNLVSTEGFFVT